MSSVHWIGRCHFEHYNSGALDSKVILYDNDGRRIGHWSPRFWDVLRRAFHWERLEHLAVFKHIESWPN
ncbi:MAG: hypothetical protein KGI08_10935 [Thaumarchaeota archaeon]|nr:hypothetical protein [Nitrososphaerota archaeon]